MKLTIGLPCYNNFTEVFYTVQALRMYHDLTDCEILVIDNFGKDPELEKFVKNQGAGIVRYEKCAEGTGPAYAKDQVFRKAKGDMVLCLDSHVMLAKGALDNIPFTDDFIQGPLMYCDLKHYACEWKPVWRGNMWGIWGDCVTKLPEQPFDIWGSGCGCFMTKRESWLGFNPDFKGFGGEEGYIQEKYRKAGRKVLCNPKLVWMHQFDRKIPHQVLIIDRIANYIIGFKELGLDLTPIKEHFGQQQFSQALTEVEKRCPSLK